MNGVQCLILKLSRIVAMSSILLALKAPTLPRRRSITSSKIDFTLIMAEVAIAEVETVESNCSNIVIPRHTG